MTEYGRHNLVVDRVVEALAETLRDWYTDAARAAEELAGMQGAAKKAAKLSKAEGLALGRAEGRAALFREIFTRCRGEGALLEAGREEVDTWPVIDEGIDLIQRRPKIILDALNEYKKQVDLRVEEKILAERARFSAMWKKNVAAIEAEAELSSGDAARLKRIDAITAKRKATREANDTRTKKQRRAEITAKANATRRANKAATKKRRAIKAAEKAEARQGFKAGLEVSAASLAESVLASL